MAKKRYYGTVRVMSQVRGKSNKAYDRRLKALKPGKRRTRNPHMYHGRLIHKSTVYYERRPNRSDNRVVSGL